MVACARKRKRRSAKHKNRLVLPPSVNNKSNITIGLQMLRDSTFPAGPIALDCEMVGVGEKMESALARATIVAYDGTVLYDVVCKPVEVITDYRTPYSGIRPTDMIRAIPFSAVQDQVKRIINDRIVVGHALSHDFAVLNLDHPKELIRDTSKAPYAKTKALMKGNASVSLKRLSSILLGIQIQVGEHDSAEDARANMEIYKLVEKEWEAGIKESSAKRSARRRKKVSESDVPRPEEGNYSFPQDIPDSELLADDAIWEPQKCDTGL
nr:interferon stimulated 20 kDa exonuclease [Hymenolepis microstoma]